MFFILDLKNGRIEECAHFYQMIIDSAINQWRDHFHACVRAEGWTFWEHDVNSVQIKKNCQNPTENIKTLKKMVLFRANNKQIIHSCNRLIVRAVQ